MRTHPELEGCEGFLRDFSCYFFFLSWSSGSFDRDDEGYTEVLLKLHISESEVGGYQIAQPR